MSTKIAEQAQSPAFDMKAYHRLVMASGLGSSIEHYDFFSYVIIAPLVFDKLFFPKLDSIAATIAVYATFAVGFISRPVGGILFGHFGDRYGRKVILMVTLLMMGICSFLIGCIPIYATIGIWAPILLVLCRFTQGFAFGGEYSTAIVLTLENAPAKNRGFFASWINASGPIGIIAASGLITGLMGFFGKDQFAAWAWRIPFLLSLLLVAVGTYMRYKCDESLLFAMAVKDKKVAKVPIFEVLRKCKLSVLLGTLVNMVHSSFQYMATMFVVTYAVTRLAMPQARVTSGYLAANILELVMVLLIARFSDRIGRRPVLLFGIALAAIFYPLLFQILLLKNVLYLVLGITFAVGVVHALIFAPEAAFTAELFPTEIRVSGASLSKQLGIVLGGGFSPLIAASLMGHGTNFAPVIWYFTAIAAAAFVSVLVAKECFKKALY
jgi:MFS family permease